MLLAFYLCGYAFAFRRIAGQFAWHMAENGIYGRRDYPDGEQWAGAIATAAVLSVVWPLALPIAYSIAKTRNGGGLFYCPPVKRDELLRARIRDLEREAGIR